MAICPECFTMDKSFFAPRCHACNQRIGFLHQVIEQLLYVTVALGGFILIMMWIFG